MNAEERAQLAERHLDVARRAAKMIYPRVREHVEFDELVAIGNAGLAEAAQRFDPDRGIAFDTYAWYRVQGAIVDCPSASGRSSRSTTGKVRISCRPARSSGSRSPGPAASTRRPWIDCAGSSITMRELPIVWSALLHRSRARARLQLRSRGAAESL